ncbi:MAG: hypothetical protein RM022_030400 [Nostoc sp. EfeVER01]|uniref:hypothetical protein n=1 Tax=unclassified Nostoc TaxID=2593658 RepID=UPI002AD20810|nr:MULTISPECIES: hypothetical protein [unclassified Nostoc]MDZ7944704.1 hypothetical protein [Nostoc sp. EfeVER01]MDZ7995824.1 hypothetical protein [Nostoc sp. EspVER01]
MDILCIVWCAIATKFFSRTTAGRFKALRVLADKLEHGEVSNGESGFPLGLSTVKLWSRAINHADKHQRDYQNLPIEEKESYKWLASAESSKRCFEVGGAKMVTHIGDRESDLFEEFATIPNKNNHSVRV